MAGKKERSEKWRTFVSSRFLPQFWEDIKPRLWTTVLGVLIAVLVLLAQIHYGIITSGVQLRILSILWPYALLLLALTAYHLVRTPWLISNEHLDAIVALKQTILERESLTAQLKEAIRKKDDNIRTLKELPKRSAAEQHDHDKTRKALQLMKEPAVTALRYIRSQGSLTFSFGGATSAILPSGLSPQTALWVYRHCASEGILSSTRGLGNSEETFTVPPKMEKVLDEVLFEEQQ